MDVLKKGKSGIVSSSGGNAGLAAAWNAQRLGLTADVFVPVTTKQVVIDRLKKYYDAEVHTSKDWENWNAADAAAKEFLVGKNLEYVSPYDDQRLWEGHGTMIDEMVE